MKQLFIAILFVFSVTFAYASPLDDLDQLSDDLLYCSAFYSIMSNMTNETANELTDEIIKQHYSKMSILFFNAGVLTTSWVIQLKELSSYAGKSDDITEKLDKKINQITQEIIVNSSINEFGQYIINFDNVIIVKYGQSCKTLIDNPDILKFFSIEKTAL